MICWGYNDALGPIGAVESIEVLGSIDMSRSIDVLGSADVLGSTGVLGSIVLCGLLVGRVWWRLFGLLLDARLVNGGRSRSGFPPTIFQPSSSYMEKQNEHPNVGGVSIRSRNGAPPRKGCVINLSLIHI